MDANEYGALTEEMRQAYQNYNPRRDALAEARALLTLAAEKAMAAGALPAAELAGADAPEPPQAARPNIRTAAIANANIFFITPMLPLLFPFCAPPLRRLPWHYYIRISIHCQRIFMRFVSFLHIAQHLTLRARLHKHIYTKLNLFYVYICIYSLIMLLYIHSQTKMRSGKNA